MHPTTFHWKSYMENSLFGCVWVGLKLKSAFAFQIFFLFFHTFKVNFCYCSFTWTVIAKFNFFTFQHKFYCLRIHRFHFSTTFSLKMGPTILFTYLKIILLQYFSVFSFNFQFSTVSKRIQIFYTFYNRVEQCLQCKFTMLVHTSLC